MTTEPENPCVEAPEVPADGLDGPGASFPDPDAFEDGDSIDSAAIDEDPDGFQQPADPDAEPVDETGDDEPGDDA